MRIPARLLAACLAALTLPSAGWATEEVDGGDPTTRAVAGPASEPKVPAGLAPSAGFASAPERFPRIEAHAELLNAVLFRSDSDFDRTAPAYDANGQTVGFVGTIFRPTIVFHVASWLRIHYDAELGINYWSRNDPDVQEALAPSILVLKHRQVFAEGEVSDGRAGFKVGYSRFIDSTGLFLNHWLGNAQLSWAPSTIGRVTLFAGQIADSTFEGIEIGQNNFIRDITVFGLRATYDLSARLQLDAGIEALYDAHVVGHSRTVITPSLRVDGQIGKLTGFVGAALQIGRFEGEGSLGGDQTLLAWALQAHGVVPVSHFELTMNLMMLSADDAIDGNAHNGAFLYSGKSSSATVLLTEDETLDWHDNLDKRLSTRRGGFWQNRAGLALADLKFVWAGERLRPGVILGAATVLNPRNALGGIFVGMEADAVLEARLYEHLSCQLLVGTLIPGSAGAALINRIDPTRTTATVSAEASIKVTY